MPLAHGLSSVTVCDHILLCKLSGTFNKEGLDVYVRQVKDGVAQFKGQPFAMVIDDLALEGGTPEAFNALQEYNEWLNQQPLIAKAFIIDNPMLKEMILKRAPALNDQHIEFFYKLEDAKNWVMGLLNDLN